MFSCNLNVRRNIMAVSLHANYLVRQESNVARESGEYTDKYSETGRYVPAS